MRACIHRLTMITFGAVHLLVNARSYAHFYNHWSRVMCVLDTDCTKGVRRFLWASNIWFCIILSVLIGMFFIGVIWIPDMTGILSAADACAALLFRLFKVQLRGKDGRTKRVYRIVGFYLIVSHNLCQKSPSGSKLLNILLAVLCLLRLPRDYNSVHVFPKATA